MKKSPKQYNRLFLVLKLKIGLNQWNQTESGIWLINHQVVRPLGTSGFSILNMVDETID